MTEADVLTAKSAGKLVLHYEGFRICTGTNEGLRQGVGNIAYLGPVFDQIVVLFMSDMKDDRSVYMYIRVCL